MFTRIKRKGYWVSIIVAAVVLLLPIGTAFAASSPIVISYNAEVDSLTATLNGNITATGNGTNDERGFVWGYYSFSNPGNVAPAISGYDYNWTEAGSFNTGAFDYLATLETALSSYYFRACAHNDLGWAYSDELNFFIGEADKVYLEFRPDLDETRIRGNVGIPSDAQIGIYNGYSLPIWNSNDEELYFLMCVPDRWDGESHILIHVITALANANESGNSYQLEVTWEHETPNEDFVPVTNNQAYVTRTIYSNTQYESYMDWAIVLYNADVGDDVEPDDQLTFRFRRIAAGGQLKDLDGELIILSTHVLFARGDLLGDPDSIVTITTFPGLIDDLIADETLIGGIDMIFLGMLAFAGIMSFLAFRTAFFGLKLIAGMSWFMFFIYIQGNPPTGVAEGSGTHTALMVISIGMGLMIVLAGLGRGIEQTKDRTGAFSVKSEGFHLKLPGFMKDQEVATRQRRQQNVEEYREQFHRALHPSRKRK